MAPPALHRAIVCVDVEGFGDRRRTNPDQLVVRTALYTALRQAFARCGISWDGDDCYHEDRGDGALILISPAVPKQLLVAALPEVLGTALAEHNETAAPQSRIRLRIALHAGEIHHDDHGVTGASLNFAFRLSEAGPLKRALRDSPGALALIASDWFFQEVVRHDRERAAWYHRVQVSVKETQATAWICLPDHPLPPGGKNSMAAEDLADTRGDPGWLGRGDHGRPPQQLPLDVSAFTGRAAELEELDGLLAATGGEPTAVVISAVSGAGGVGKTALAVHWAHRVANHFGDGQLYVDLRGYDPDQPMPPGDALAAFLRALGVDDSDIPHDIAERAAHYRTMLTGRRMLIVLDNASSPEQVRLLLPGAPSCLVMVTSRDSLAGLVARYGARRIDLDLLPLHDAVALLRTLIGERVDSEANAAAALAQRCARLPLALRVAAELAAARPAMSLAELSDELADQQRRLELLDAAGDPRTTVRGVLSWSYQHLPADAARAFRLLGLHPGTDLDSYATAALIDTTVEQARHLLELLARAHLIHSTGAGRHSMHDLLRAYAVSLAVAYDSAEDQRAARTRLFDYYLATAAAAMDIVHPAERHRRPRIGPAASPAPPMADRVIALTWLDVERVTLSAVAAHAAANGWPGHSVALAATLFRYFDTGGHAIDAFALHTQAGRAAHDSGDTAAEARALIDLGSVCWRLGRHGQAADHLQQALALFRQVGDRGGEARALDHIGLLEWRQGRYAPALDRFQQALTLFRQVGNRSGEAYAVDHLGLAYRRQGRYEQAADQFRQALILFRQVGNRSGEGYALTHIGMVGWRQGQYRQAADHLHQALALFREIGDRGGQAYALDDLGSVCWRQGDHLHLALALARDIGDWYSEARALNGLGETWHATGHPGQARRQHAAALAVAVQSGDRYEQARAHTGIAQTHAAGEPDRARRHWQQALTRYSELDVPDADDVRACLTALDGP